MKTHKNFRSHLEGNFLNIYRSEKGLKRQMQRDRQETHSFCPTTSVRKPQQTTSELPAVSRYRGLTAVLLNMASCCCGYSSWRLEGRNYLHLQRQTAVRLSETSETTANHNVAFVSSELTFSVAHNHNQSRTTDKIATS